MPRKVDAIDSKDIEPDKSLLDPKEKAAIAEGDNETRRAAAVKMRVAGAAYTDIAEVLGYATPATARRAVERGIADAAATEETIEQQRWLVDRRLERLFAAVSPKAHRPGPDQLEYAAAALRILDRKMTLHHLGGTNVTVTPSTERVREVVAHFEQLADRGDEQEADVMAFEDDAEAHVVDAEVVED